MKIDYHMHFEYGDYDLDWVQGFIDTAIANGLDEIGISEHSHTFPEFEHFYYDDLILDDSFVGNFQRRWLHRNKFKHTIDEYFSFMDKLQKHVANSKHPIGIKIGIEVCNFRDQTAVKKLLDSYDFDYIIGSVHFIDGWAFDSSEIKDEWNNRSLKQIYERYTSEIENMTRVDCYDVLGHPFNIRLFKYFPKDFDVTPHLDRAALALHNANMGIDVNTGTLYRYPIQEISPFPEFMQVAFEYKLPVVITSDAHKPEDCGKFNDTARKYVKSFGFERMLRFSHRKRSFVDIDD